MLNGGGERERALLTRKYIAVCRAANWGLN